MTKTTTTTYLIENTTSGVLLGAYEGADELDAYKIYLFTADERIPTEDVYWLPPAINVYDPATLDRELTEDERAALGLAADGELVTEATA